MHFQPRVLFHAVSFSKSVDFPIRLPRRETSRRLGGHLLRTLPFLQLDGGRERGVTTRP